jgi:heme exporter protein CcmD
MDWNADHVGYVVAAYAVVAVVLAAVLVRTVMKAKSLKAALREMNLPDTGQRDQP